MNCPQPPQTTALPPAVFIMGPTAAGKTDAVIDLFEQFQGHIISVDSALVYRGMDIGTAKPDPQTLRRAPHALVDIRDPQHSYSAATFRADALREIRSAQAQGRLPLLAGGTMLYYRSLQQGLSSLPQADAATRQQLAEEAARLGWPAMHRQLQRIDPVSARRIHPNDPQRIQRALEVWQLTGKPMSHWYQQPQPNAQPPFSALKIILAPADRQVLHRRIERRFEQMLAAGFIEEVEALKARPEIHADLPSMRAVGYRQVWQYLDGKLDFEEMRYRGIVATRQLAKRQWTWLRKEKDAHWLDPGDKNSRKKIRQLVADFLKNSQSPT
jgi:tRNA dimethylallyltransferase